MPDNIESRPYPNEHSARIKDPNLFMKGDENWGSKDITTGIRIILGRLKSDGKWETQAYRFKSDKFTVAEAKKWLKDHDVKYILFEPAEDKKNEDLENIEWRSMIIADAEMRIIDDETPKLVGYAAKYGVKANLGYFIEKIRAGAFDEVLKSSDARALKNHNPNLLLGRESSGTLQLESNSVGLRFEIDVPNTTTGHDTTEEIRRGDLNGCSFAFIVGEDEWKHAEGQPSERTIVKIAKLFDVGPVTYPAYEDTTVAVRSLEQNRQVLKIEDGEEKNKEIDQQRQLEIEKGYRKAGRIINRIKSAEV